MVDNVNKYFITNAFSIVIAQDMTDSDEQFIMESISI